MPKILLTSPKPARVLYYPDEALAGLRALGEVRLNDADTPWDAAGLVAAARDCDVIVSDRQTPGPAAVFDGLPSLRAFVRCAVDIRNVDVPAASRHGVLVTHASPGFVASVAELVVGFMIDLGRGIGNASQSYRRAEVPAPVMGRQLKGSTLGVMGYGAIGRHLADLGVAFGMRVLVSDPFVKSDKKGIEQVELPRLLAESDFVVCLVVANDQTENLVNAAAFARMKKTAFFINVSRGNLVDEAALEWALKQGQIAGAAMDVGRAHDQMPTPALAMLPTMIATPHIGGLTPQAAAHQALETVRQVSAIVKGAAPPGAVNADKATRLKALA
ncbi:MAG: hydroxyacid dehydrogenase [Alphaproteobacteria bacterium]|nr:hydroxyacid dehydrogenase [Alphaproteobacteria bacterium]